VYQSLFQLFLLLGGQWFAIEAGQAEKVLDPLTESGNFGGVQRQSALLENGTDPRQQAEVLKWMFFEQYSHEPYIAVARFIVHYLGRPESQEARLDGLKAGGEKALAVMEQQLKQSPYLCGDAPTIADIALYAYTHVAEEGIFSLQGWPAIRSWIARIEAHPRHLTLPAACQAS